MTVKVEIQTGESSYKADEIAEEIAEEVAEAIEGDAEENGEEIAEAIETVSSDAVEITQIEAERDIAIAAIQAETEQTRIEKESDRETWLVERISSLETQVTEMREIISILQSPSVEMATQVAEEVTEELLQTETETSSILPFISDPINSIQTEVSVESADEKPVTVEVTGRRKYHRI